MELTGKITKKLAVQKGTSQRGEWQKQEFVIEYQDGQYPSHVCFNVWGADKVNELAGYNEGDEVRISFGISAREYAGRWYNDLRAWRIEKLGGASSQSPSMSASAPVPAPPITSMPQADASEPEEDDLPF